MVLLAVVLALSSIYLVFRLTIAKTRSSTCLVGKTALITGGNAGIGFEAALNLASRGCRVIIADKDDSDGTRRRIIEETGNPNVITKSLDLGSLQSVRQFAQYLIHTEQRLDILVNNAGIGVAAGDDQYTKDGLNEVMQVNTFGPFLLTHLLLDLLKKSAPSRIIFTSSMMAFAHNLTLETINFPIGTTKGFLVTNVIFSNANLCNIIIADGFAERLKGTNVTSNSLHPGITKTEIFGKMFKILGTPKIFVHLWNAIMMIIGKSAWEGAQTTIHLATAKELEDVSGCHFWECRPFFKPAITKNSDFTKEVWATIERLVKFKSGN